MNVLFLSLLDFNSLSERNIYTDLLRCFAADGHSVYCVSPTERRQGRETELLADSFATVLKLKIGNTQKVGIIEKGISTLLIEPQYIRGIRKYFKNIKFDLVLYATPPVTFARVIRFVKKRDGAKTYLMLKDIFPQNSLDIGLLKTTGIKGLIYKYFKDKEKKLYALSDTIGCMSEANREYLLKHNPSLDARKVELCSNCIEPQDLALTDVQKREERRKYNLPSDKTIFVYGGNLGKPQDVPFIVKCLSACADLENVHFLIAGSGTEHHILSDYVEKEQPGHITLLNFVPKEQYDRMIACCDVGLVFLDYRFTIPNFPSRLLSYLQAGLAVLCCTDRATDIGSVITQAGAGRMCYSNDPTQFARLVREMSVDRNALAEMGTVGHNHLLSAYSAEKVYAKVFKSLLAERTSDENSCM